MDGRTPRHVAIIMDGNGRWAQGRGHSRAFGHVRGTARVKPIVREASRQGIQALTLYAFSTENWARPERELSVLWKLLKKYLLKEADEMDRENIRFRVIGEMERLDTDVRRIVEQTVQRTAKNTGLQLTFAVSYGSRRELVHAAQVFARECAEGKARPEDLDEARLARNLWTGDMGELSEVDLVIRTSGEIRVSNFLLWQAAYAEFVFLEICWPEFTVEHFHQALKEYAGRERRFGSVTMSSQSRVSLV